MPRRKRSSPSSEDSKAKRARAASSRSSKKHGDSDTAFSTKRCTAWFYEYTGAEQQDVMEPEGMEKFCEDIGVEPENIVMLSLAWKLGAEQMGFFTLAEWLKGMTEIQCDSVVKLQNKLDFLRALLNDPVAFKGIYRYTFDFAREKGQRSMDIDTAKILLALLLGKRWTLFASFHNFLEQSKYKVINKDQWCNVLEFSRLIKCDLSNYDEDGAWPVMLDEFVEWYREHNSVAASAASTSSQCDYSMC